MRASLTFCKDVVQLLGRDCSKAFLHERRAVMAVMIHENFGHLESLGYGTVLQHTPRAWSKVYHPGKAFVPVLPEKLFLWTEAKSAWLFRTQ